MNAIAVYHQPQECGSPYLTFISQETGEVVETVDIPEGYFYSGCQHIKQLHKVYSFTEQIDRGGRRPNKHNTVPSAHYGYNPHHYEYVVTKVTDIKHDMNIFPTWRATLHIDACIAKSVTKYSSSDDYFKKQMTESGFNMKGWCLYKRRKTEFLDFLKQVASTYKDYHLVNLIQIG